MKNNFRGIENFYKEVRDILIKGEFKGLSDDDITERMRPLCIAYHLMKTKHCKQVRQSGERYFEHLRETAYIYMYELDKPILDGIIISLLHDAIEDTDLLDRSIENIFSKEIAEGVLILSKHKSLNNKLYFRELLYAKDYVKKVKIADRIHNLRTLHYMNEDKKQKKIKETKEFMIPICQSMGYKEGEKKLIEAIGNSITLNRNYHVFI